VRSAISILTLVIMDINKFTYEGEVQTVFFTFIIIFIVMDLVEFIDNLLK